MLGGFSSSGQPWKHSDEKVESLLKKGARLQYKVLVKQNIIPKLPQIEIDKMIRDGEVPDSFEDLYNDDTEWDEVLPEESAAMAGAMEEAMKDPVFSAHMESIHDDTDHFFKKFEGPKESSAEMLSRIKSENNNDYKKYVPKSRYKKKPKEFEISKVEFDSVIVPSKTKDDIKINLVAESSEENKKKFNDMVPDDLFEKGKGSVMLFYGDSGTGKTMMAEAISNYLKRDLKLVSAGSMLGGIVGSTEQNITKLFREGKEENLVIVIDEIDGLITKKRNADQQHQVSVINHLMKEIERYVGVCILTTNCRTHLDPALERRVSLKVKFERPTKEERTKIWKRLFHSGIKLSADVKIEELAEAKLTGGQIKNVILGAIKRSIYYKSDKITYMHIRPCIDKEIEDERLRRI